MNYEEDILIPERVMRAKGFLEENDFCMLIDALFEFNRTPDKEVKLVIDSSGGEAAKGLAFYDYLRSMRVPVTGIVIGSCDSVAIAILQGCVKRIASKHSGFFFHSLESDCSFKLLQHPERHFQKRIQRARELQEKYLDILSPKSIAGRSGIKKLMRDGDAHGMDISAEMALSYGFIDEIVEKVDIF